MQKIRDVWTRIHSCEMLAISQCATNSVLRGLVQTTGGEGISRHAGHVALIYVGAKALRAQALPGRHRSVPCTHRCVLHCGNAPACSARALFYFTSLSRGFEGSVLGGMNAKNPSRIVHAGCKVQYE